MRLSNHVPVLSLNQGVEKRLNLTSNKLPLPVKSIAVGLEDSLGDIILCKSGTNSGGILEKVSLDK